MPHDTNFGPIVSQPACPTTLTLDPSSRNQHTSRYSLWTHRLVAIVPRQPPGQLVCKPNRQRSSNDFQQGFAQRPSAVRRRQRVHYTCAAAAAVFASVAAVAAAAAAVAAAPVFASASAAAVTVIFVSSRSFAGGIPAAAAAV
eukprot:358448-Chlamydomonas_euryale.AAC.8